MKFNISTRAMTLVGLVALTLSSSLPSSASGNILLSGGNIADSGADESFLTALGYTYTYVSPSALSTTSFAGYSGIWLGWDTNYPGIASRQGDIAAFAKAGGCVLAEMAYTNLGDLFPTVTSNFIGGGDNVNIVAAGDPINSGLTNAGLSSWSNSYHSVFTSNGAYSVLTDTPDFSLPVTLGLGVGNGHITLTGQDISYQHRTGCGN